ncbi:HEAT repeat domain-containing protein, partial [Planctomycetota bacterium]
KGDEAAAAIAGAIAGAGPAGKTALVGVLAARGAAAHSDIVLATAADKDESVRLASIEALGALVDDTTLPGLVGLLAKAGTNAERNAAEGAARAACLRINDPEKSAPPVAGALDGASPAAQCALLRILGKIGGPKALEAARGLVKSDNAEVQGISTKVLAGWPTPEALDTLLEIAKTASTDDQKLLAHKGYVRLLDVPVKERTPEKAVELHKAGLEAAIRPDEKKLLLAGLGRIKHIESLKAATPYFEDEALQTAAGNAMTLVAGGVAGTSRDEAKAALRKVLAATKDKGLKKTAQRTLDGIEKFEDYITTWKVSGPYKQEGKDGLGLFDVAFPPEDPEAKDVEWKAVPPAADKSKWWMVDLVKVVGGENVVAYLRAVVECPEEQEAQIQIGSDDGVKAWLNGELVHGNNLGRGVTPGEDKAKVTLKAGKNTLLLKINNGGGGWGACARFRKPDGSGIEGIKSAAE